MIRKMIIGTLLIGVSAVAPNAFAASEDECAIWLCLPAGFPSGCNDAKRAMIERLRDHKSPLPAFSSCATNNNSMSYRYNTAAYLPQRRICTEYWYWGNNACRTYTDFPREMVKDTRCYTSEDYFNPQANSPPYCSDTYEYVDIFINGNKTGKTRYWKRAGRNIVDTFSE